MEVMPSVVILRVKNPGREASDLLGLLERELGVGARPQTASFVPVAFEDLEARRAGEVVREVLDRSGVDWREHLELRA